MSDNLDLLKTQSVITQSLITHTHVEVRGELNLVTAARVEEKLRQLGKPDPECRKETIA